MFQFNFSISFAEIFIIVSLVVIGSFLGVGIGQRRRANRHTSMNFIITLLNGFIHNELVMNIFYRIENNDFHYTGENFHGTEEERILYKLLTMFNNFAKIYLTGVLPKNDIKAVESEFLTIYRNGEVKKYLEFIDNWELVKNTNIHPFSAFLKLSNIIEKQTSKF